jgi:protein associated with RNAse G/E
MKPGDLIHVRACKADGTVYRSWHTAIESVDAGSLVTISPAGGRVWDRVRGEYFTQHVLRSYYWFDKFYNLIEVFDADGALVELYINIASPPRFDNGGMSFTDHELDVSKYPPEAAQLVDEDEFAEAIGKYQYTDDFQRKLHVAAREAMDLANNWQAKPVPDFGGGHA